MLKIHARPRAQLEHLCAGIRTSGRGGRDGSAMRAALRSASSRPRRAPILFTLAIASVALSACERTAAKRADPPPPKVTVAPALTVGNRQCESR